MVVLFRLASIHGCLWECDLVWTCFPVNLTGFEMDFVSSESNGSFEQEAGKDTAGGAEETAAPPHAAGPLGTAPKGRKGDVQSSDWTHTHGEFRYSGLERAMGLFFANHAVTVPRGGSVSCHLPNLNKLTDVNGGVSLG